MSGGAKPDISFGRCDNWWEDATFQDTITELVAELLADLLEEDRDQLAHDLQSAAA
jgi:hypothetical protein